MEENTALNTDFNLEEDFKVDPLIPNGTYFGSVIEVKRDVEKHNISWKVVLDGNGGFKSDGETAIDGSHTTFYNYLPKESDRTEKTANGSSTKFQSKVNMLKKFADGMKLNLNTLSIIDEAIANGEYIGLAVSVAIKNEEYPTGSGQFSSKASNMVAA